VPGLRLVICGSAAGTVSARRGAYYAGPGNKFWPILAATGLTPRLLLPEEFPLLLGFGIGLTDLAKHAFGPDVAIRRDHYDPEGLAERIAKSGALNYGLQPRFAALPPIFVLPSTSGLASGAWDARHWHDLAALVLSPKRLP
jgi:TDG/mug DNA glycosylase family protein